MQDGPGRRLVLVTVAASGIGAATFGLWGLSEVLRFDLEPHDVGVVLVCPGAARTPLVGSVDIVGVDRDDPRVRRAVAAFERHAVSPERVAAQMVQAVRRGRFLVLTSADVRVGVLAQRYVPFAYDAAMRLLNRRVRRLLRSAR